MHCTHYISNGLGLIHPFSRPCRERYLLFPLFLSVKQSHLAIVFAILLFSWKEFQSQKTGHFECITLGSNVYCEIFNLEYCKMKNNILVGLKNFKFWFFFSRLMRNEGLWVVRGKQCTYLGLHVYQPRYQNAGPILYSRKCTLLYIYIFDVHQLSFLLNWYEYSKLFWI